MTFLESLPSPKILYKSASKASPEVFQTAIRSKKICQTRHWSSANAKNNVFAWFGAS